MGSGRQIDHSVKPWTKEDAEEEQDDYSEDANGQNLEDESEDDQQVP